MDHETDLGGPAAGFPSTRCSLVRAAASSDPAARRQAFEDLITAYWKPVYRYLRIKAALANEDAKDLTQAFFARAFEKGFFDTFDPTRARFRTFLRVCVDRFVANRRREEASQKHGGHVSLVSLDFAAADDELQQHALPDRADPDEFLRQEWLRTIFALAVEDLRRECAESGKDTTFALFRRYDLEGLDASGLTYAQLAEEFGVPLTQVTNHLAFARRQFRRHVLDRLRATTGDLEEFREESRRLFGGEAP